MPLTPRDATRADYPAFARLFLELQVPDPTPTEDAFDERIRPHALFLEGDAGIVAYAFWWPLTEVARVVHVVVAPEARGQGVGHALMREIAGRARGAGCTRWMLNVKPDNAPAIRLYERWGMRSAGPMTAMRIAWQDVAKLPEGAPTEAFLVAPEDDAQVEAAMELPSGQIAARREGGGFALVGLRRAGEVVAFAAFDPTFPGGMPFAAATPELTRALLEAMRPHARPGDEAVRFVAYRQDVIDAARAAGAEVLLEVLQMAGPIAQPA